MRRSLIGLVTVVTALAMLVESSAAAPSGQLSPAAQTLSQCVQTNHELSVLMLIDESGSLRTTDPLNQRVDGIRAALTGLADLADTPVSGRKPRVSVLMAGFYGLVHPNPDTEADAAAGQWQTLDGSTIDSLNEEASRYAALNSGRATDYATALLAAHQLLVERAAAATSEGGAPPCQALIWFTDGRYSIPARIGKSGEGLPKTVPYAPNLRLDERGAGLQAVEAGKALMCRPQGLMDSIANDRIVRFTVALSTQLSPADAAFLDAATTGSAGGQRCGVDLSPRTGEYLTAQDGDRLFFAFGDLLVPSPPVKEKEVCARLACLRGTTTFTTVPGLSSFLIRASSGMDGAVLELKGPDGETVRLRPDGPDRQSLSGATIVQRWVSDRAVEVEGSFSPDSQWIGQWSYAFIDPSATTDRVKARSYSSVQLYADLEPVVTGEPTVIRGVPTKITLGLASDSGADLVSEGPLVRGASLTATVSDPATGTETSVPVVGPSGQGTFTSTVLVPNSSSTSLLYLGLTATLATASGTPVAPQYRSFSLPVRLPPGQGFPILSPSELHLPSLEGTGTASGAITITGSSVGSGCAWVGAPTIDGPDDAGRITSSSAPRADSPARCLQVDRGQSRQLELNLTPADAATGTVTASFPVHLRSDVVDGSRVVSIPVTVVLATPPDTARRAFLLAILVVIGALLPLALLYLLNRSGAHFTAPQRLLFLAQDVELSPAGIEAPTQPAFAAFEPVSSAAAPRGAKGIDIDLVRLRAVAARNLGDLFRGPHGIASTRGEGRVFAGGSSARLRSLNKGAEHEVPLSIAGTWLFLPDELEAGSGSGTDPGSSLWEDEAPIADEPSRQRTGRLILVISRSGDVDQGRELLAEASQVLRETDLHEDDEDGEPPTEEARPARSRVPAWMRRGRDRRSGDDAQAENGSEPVEAGSESFEVDPWA